MTAHLKVGVRRSRIVIIGIHIPCSLRVNNRNWAGIDAECVLEGFEIGPSRGVISLPAAFPLHEKVFSLRSRKGIGI